MQIINTIMKHKDIATRGIANIVIVLSFFVGARAGLIREDRVWTYMVNATSRCMHPPFAGTTGDFMVMRMTFDGTKEFNGQTYHCFTNVGNDHYNGTYRSKPVITRTFIDEPFLVREEEGKVYVVERDMPGVTAYMQGGPWLFGSDEVLMYDFNAREGESFMSVSTSFLLDKAEAKVKSISQVRVGDEQKRMYLLEFDYTRDSNIIEDIGVADNGFLTFFDCWDIAGDNDRIYPFDVPIHQDIRFVNYADTDGNILYGDAVKVPCTLIPELRTLISEDRIWEYVRVSESGSMTFERFRFDGQSEIGEKIYGRLMKSESDRSIKGASGHSDIEIVSGSESLAAFVREEDGKVFVMSAASFSDMVNETEEVLLYDFCPVVNTHFQLPVSDSRGYVSQRELVCKEMKVEKLDNGLYYHCLAKDNDSDNGYEYIEEFGNLGYGNLIEFADGDTEAQYGNQKLNFVYDKEGNVLYTGEGLISEGTSVQRISSGNTETVMYDLFGRRVATPQKGSIYIKDGKKEVF